MSSCSLALGISFLWREIDDVLRLIDGLISGPSKPDQLVLVGQGGVASGEAAADLGRSATRLRSTGVDVKIVDDEGLGLSRSRNLCLSSIDAQFVLIGDSDCDYSGTDFDAIRAVLSDCSSGCIVGRVRTEGGGWYRRYGSRRRQLGIFQAGSVSSVAMIVDADQVAGVVEFSELFGLGAPLGSGEEAVFVGQCLANGIDVQFVPSVVTCTHPEPIRSAPDNGRCMGVGAARRVVLGPGLSMIWIIGWSARKAVELGLVEGLRIYSATYYGLGEAKRLGFEHSCLRRVVRARLSRLGLLSGGLAQL